MSIQSVHVPSSTFKMPQLKKQSFWIRFEPLAAKSLLASLISTPSSRLRPFCSHFYLHFTSSFCSNIHLTRKLQSLTVSRVKLCWTLVYKKSACKILVKWIPWAWRWQCRRSWKSRWWTWRKTEAEIKNIVIFYFLL